LVKKYGVYDNPEPVAEPAVAIMEEKEPIEQKKKRFGFGLKKKEEKKQIPKEESVKPETRKRGLFGRKGKAQEPATPPAEEKTEKPGKKSMFGFLKGRKK
ncbi:MAG: hypothetical protein NC830_06625, partial [Candidatus Omnitrophica bacterium]|nr:hypothetical protein [Candidatus Omnitrophota bacterium]